jgi:hypothetical protein
MANGESGAGEFRRGSAADAQLDIIAARAQAIASELFATSAALRDGSEGVEGSREVLAHRLNAHAASIQALAAPTIQLRGLQRLD